MNSGPSKSGKSKMDSYNNDNVRIISKFFLYEDLSVCDDPDMQELIQNTSEYYSYPNYKKDDTSGFDWTSKMWLKSGMQPSGKRQKPMKIKLGKDQKEMLDALKTPVTLSKAESMMRKMGWDGGALGKNGLGIVAPIIPNLTYTRSTMGFGQAVEETKKEKILKKPPSSKCVLKRERKRLFQTNVLFILLDFIRNDSELEIGFDERLSKTERRTVHMLVQSLFEDDVSLKNYDSDEDLELIGVVKKNCKYIMLGTHSVGEDNNRQLYIYKEAPDHIYLVVPNDLIPDKVSDVNKPKVIEKPKIEKKENAYFDFNIFKKQIRQSRLGELISKVYKEHDENEANKSSRVKNADVKMEDAGCKTLEKSNEMSDELNSETKESLKAISSEEMNFELNSETKERIKAINSKETESNNSELNAENEERIIKAISTEEKNSELNSKNKNCDVGALNDECFEENCIKTNTINEKIIKKHTVGEVKAENNFENALNKQNFETNTNEKIIKKHTLGGEDKAENNFENALNKQNFETNATGMDLKDEKSQINIDNDIYSDIPFATRKLTDYFLEFNEDSYREMRFLGPFDNEQVDFINSFIENVHWCIKNCENAKNIFVYRKEDVYKAMRSDNFHFEINEDDKSLVIRKLEKTK